jgi:hypothetical protein
MIEKLINWWNVYMGRKYYDRRCCDTDGCILEDTGVVIESPGAGKRIRYKCNQCGDVKNLMI